MSLYLAYFISMLVLAVSILLLRYFLKPKIEWSKLQSAVISFSLVILSTALLYTTILLVTKRPFFSAGVNIILLGIIVVVSNAKFAALREPLVFSDFYLYFQAFKHPRLYLPFIGIYPIVLILVFVVLVLMGGLMLESPYFSYLSGQFAFLLVLLPIFFSLVYWGAGKLSISENLNEDVSKFGVFATLVLYFRHSPKRGGNLQEGILKGSPFNSNSKGLDDEGELSDIIVIQSESFFDARLLDASIKSNVLSKYDQLILRSLAHGQLQVPAWGANTMRTEFAFLTGLSSDVLGLAQYYPYQQLLKYRVPSLLSYLKHLGYYCVCIHPHAESFFMRDKFFKQLGFDEFIDEKYFEGAERIGPYISDEEVTHKIKGTIQSSTKPLFIFAITMENHGPLHLEDVNNEEWREYFYQDPGKELDDLIVYLRHLVNADSMISELQSFLMSRRRKALLVFYGDHVPAMSKVFDVLDYHDPRSNFFIWSTWSEELKEVGLQMDLVVENLATELIKYLHQE